MATIDIKNLDGKSVGKVDLDESVFGVEINEHLLWEVVKAQRAKKRAGTHSTKRRDEVRGGGKKPYKQKGTGRPQVGSTRTPLWRHGGTVFGPQPRSYDFRLPGKVKRGALVAALVQRMQDGALVVVDTLVATESKTKAAVELLKRLGADGKALLIDVQPDEKLGIAVRNIPGVQFLASARVGARDVMNASRIIATKAAVEKFQDL
jgi:large subunit ribosomal protein L4